MRLQKNNQVYEVNNSVSELSRFWEMLGVSRVEGSFLLILGNQKPEDVIFEEKKKCSLMEG